MKVICIIPARANSRRCPGKNTKNFCDKSLTILACEQAVRLKDYFDICLTSNDGEAIRQAKECGIENIRVRPEELCGPDASSESAIEDVLDYMKETKGAEYTHVLLLEVTSPFRQDSDITKSLELCKNGMGVKSVVSIKNFLDGEVITDGFQLEGSIHLYNTSWLYDTPYNRVNLLEIPRERAWHIDYQWQFDCAEMLFKEQGK